MSNLLCPDIMVFNSVKHYDYEMTDITVLATGEVSSNIGAIYLSITLSIYLSVCLSIYIYIYTYTHAVYVNKPCIHLYSFGGSRRQTCSRAVNWIGPTGLGTTRYPCGLLALGLPGTQVDYWPWDYQVPKWTTGLGTTRYPSELLALGLPGTQVDYWPWGYQVPKWTTGLGTTRYPCGLLALGLPGI